MNRPTNIVGRTRVRLVRAAMSAALTFGLAGGASAQLFVSSSVTDSIKQYNQTTGAYEGDFVAPGSGGLQFPQGLTFGPDSNLYVSSGSSVLRYDGTTGAPLGAFVPPGGGGLGAPSYLTFGSDNNLYVSDFANNSIQRYDSTGAPAGSAGNPADASFAVQLFNPPPPADPRNTGITAPTGLAFGPDGLLYVSSSGTDSIKRIDSTGANVEGDNGNFILNSGLVSPFGLAFDSAGNLYVSSFGTDEVRRYDSTGAFVLAYSDAALVGPDGVTIGPDGLLYVSSSGNDSVVRFMLDGTFQGAFVPPQEGGLTLPIGLTFRPQAAQVPEPSVLLLLGAGIAAAGSVASRRKRAHA